MPRLRLVVDVINHY